MTLLLQRHETDDHIVFKFHVNHINHMCDGYFPDWNKPLDVVEVYMKQNPHPKRLVMRMFIHDETRVVNCWMYRYDPKLLEHITRPYNNFTMMFEEYTSLDPHNLWLVSEETDGDTYRMVMDEEEWTTGEPYLLSTRTFEEGRFVYWTISYTSRNCASGIAYEVYKVVNDDWDIPFLQQ
jgi:hypothetical protein